MLSFDSMYRLDWNAAAASRAGLSSKHGIQNHGHHPSVAAFGVSYNSGGYQSRHDRRPIDSIKLTLSSAGWVRF
jgi:hypothetical protein